MHGDNAQNYEKLHNPHCKTWKGQPFHSFTFLYNSMKDGEKPPKGSEACKVYFYLEPKCEGEGVTLGPAIEAFDRCAQIHDPVGVRSVKVVC